MSQPTNRRNTSKPLTPEERTIQRAAAKIKRLNTKLTHVKLLIAEMDKAVDSGKTSVTTRQVKKWSEQLKAILNVKNEEEE